MSQHLKHTSKVKLSHADGMPTVLIPVADGSEELEAVTVFDVLARAGARVIMASVEDELTVVCSRGVKLAAHCFIADCLHEKWDMIVCPGGMPGAESLGRSEPLHQLLRKQTATGKYVGAICAAPAMVLAHHNLLDGKAATCYPGNTFTSKIERYVDEPVVQDGNVITSQGPGTAMPFALKLVEVLFGAHKEEEVRRGLLA